MGDNNDNLLTRSMMYCTARIDKFRFALTVIAICVCWYSLSSASSILNKIIMQSYPYPLTVALTSLVSIPLYASPLLRIWNIRQRPISSAYLCKFIVPIAIGKAIAVSSAQFSLWKVPVSYVHTVKATMPLFAVLSARIILGERQTTRVYISLIPIFIGVAIASITELSFDIWGLIAALTSTFTYSLMNSLVKRVLADTDMHPIKLLAINAQLAAVIFLPFWCLHDALPIWRSIILDTNRVLMITYFQPNQLLLENSTNRPADLHFGLLLIASGFLSFAQNLCAFTLIHKLSALSYAVTNATKRITVISVSLLTLHNPVTYPNMFGMLLAIIGVFLYNRAKQTQKEHRHQLPLTKTHTTLSDASLVMFEKQPNEQQQRQRLMNGFVDSDRLETVEMNGNMARRSVRWI